MEVFNQQPSPTKITDVNIDCLEHIFNFLPLPDLLNVADTAIHLRKAAKMVFVRCKYGSQMVKLEDFNFGKGIVNTDDKILITDLKTCLRFVRCFGHLIRKLTLHIILEKNRAFIGDYLSEYCAESLKEVAFEVGTINNFTKPFANVEKVRFLRHCHLSRRLTQFNKWFPKMRSLKFIGLNEVIDHKCIEDHFEHLEHLSIEEFQFFPNETILNAIQLNRNLKSLRLHWDWNANFLRTVSEYLPQLESLEIECYVDETNVPQDEDVIHFKSVRKFKISLLQPDDSYEQFRRYSLIPKIPLTFDALQECCLQADFRVNRNFFNFLAQNPTITKLNLKVDRVSNQIFVDKLRIGHTLPQLIDINFNECRFTVRAVIRLLEEFATIDKMSVTFSDSDEFVNLVKSLPDQWTATIDPFRRVKIQRSICLDDSRVKR